MPSDYLAGVQRAFHQSATYKNLVGRWPRSRCVVVDYADDFHIDVVPYIARAGRTYITNRDEPPDGGTFEYTNPEGFTEWIDERQRLTNGHFIKVVRLAKYLRDHKNTFTCKSVILTTLLGNTVTPLDQIAEPGLLSRPADQPAHDHVETGEFASHHDAAGFRPSRDRR